MSMPFQGSSSHDRLFGTLLFIFCIALYAATSPRTVAPEDDGLFILAGYFLGIAHPPGYPLFSLLGNLFSALPFSSIPYRLHLLSGLSGAATVLSLWACLRALDVSRYASAIAALSLSMSATVWGQAIIAEVYTLNAALSMLSLFLAIRWHKAVARNSKASPSFRLAALVFGLGLSNHWPLLMLASLGLACIYLSNWRPFLRSLASALPWFLLGLTPYIWMVIRSNAEPGISFYGPIRDINDFWFVISRQGYASVDQVETAGLTDKLNYSGFLLKQYVHQFSPVGAVIAGIGFVSQWKVLDRALATALTVMFLCSGFLLAGLLGFDYDAYWSTVFSVYPLVSYAVLAIWLGLGLSTLIGFSDHLGKQGRNMIRALGILPVLLTMSGSFSINQRADYRFAEDYARAVLAALPERATLFVHGDLSFGPIAYEHLIMRMRPDIRLLSPFGLVLGDRVLDSRRTTEEERQDILRRFITDAEQPVCSVGDGMPNDRAHTDFWLFRCWNRGKENSFRLLPSLYPFYENLDHYDLTGDTWSETLREMLKQRLASILVFAHFSQSEGGNAQPFALPPELTNSFHAHLGATKLLLETIGLKSEAHKISARGLTDRMMLLLDQANSKQELAWAHYLKGKTAEFDGNGNDARSALRKAMEVWPSAENPATMQLQQ